MNKTRKRKQPSDIEILASLAEWAKSARENYHMNPLADALDDGVDLVKRLCIEIERLKPKDADGDPMRDAVEKIKDMRVFGPRRTAELGIPDGVEIRPVPGMESKYAAGSDGHVYCYSDSKTFRYKPRPFQMREGKHTSGYPVVGIWINGQRSQARVHVLVCSAFHGEKPGGWYEVRHLDGTRDNNRPENLRWGTRAENVADRMQHGTTARGENHGMAKLNDDTVRFIRDAVRNRNTDTGELAAVIGVDRKTITNVASGTLWDHVRDGGKGGA